MRNRPIDLLLLLALIAGTSYYFSNWEPVEGPLGTAWKGAGVSLLAIWAFARGRPWIGLVMAFGALGDMLLDAISLETGAVAFLIGHLIAIGFYWRSRTAPVIVPAFVAVGVALASYLLSGDLGVALYSIGLGAMAGTALTSRFPLATVGLGAVLFVVSDLLIFAQLGPMGESSAARLLIWPTYFAGQALITWGVVRSRADEDFHDRI